jgi:hypothetical protein
VSVAAGASPNCPMILQQNTGLLFICGDGPTSAGFI